MSWGEMATRWTIRLALACFFAGAAAGLAAGRHPRWMLPAKWLWSAGCFVYLAHVLCAFEFFHDWSHEAAWKETARQTDELLGWHWGGGLYLNYVFTAAWVADVLWMWAAPDAWRRRPRALLVAVYGFMLFIVFNATVVFEAGLLRWLSLAAFAALGAGWWLGRTRTRQPR